MPADSSKLKTSVTVGSGCRVGTTDGRVGTSGSSVCATVDATVGATVGGTIGPAGVQAVIMSRSSDAGSTRRKRCLDALWFIGTS